MIHKINTAGEHAEEKQLHAEIQLLQGRGITGDKNFGEKKWKDQNLTLIDLEEIKYSNRSLDQNVAELAMRRNLITRGIRLIKLEGKCFSVNDVKLYGVELYESCAWLGEQLETGELKNADIFKELVESSSLRANVLSSRKIRFGVSINSIS